VRAAPTVVALALATLLTACGGSDAPTAGPASVPPTAPTASAGKGEVVEVPITTPRPPSDFDGAEAHAAAYDDFVEQNAIADARPAGEAYGLTQEVCSILSGGGAVTAKVDYWAGTTGFAAGESLPVIASASALCPDELDAYTRQRDGAAPSTPAVKADLARFYVLQPTGSLGLLDGLTDEEVAAAAETECTALADLDGPLPAPNDDQQRAAQVRTVALALAYCPDRLPG
jgi:hypothetical protein